MWIGGVRCHDVVRIGGVRCLGGVMMWYLQIGGVMCHDVVHSDRRGQVS